MHPALRRLASADGELLVGGVPLRRLAERAGQTPFYAYDRAAITSRVGELRDALPPAIRLHYAMKANPMPAVVGHLAGLVDGLDVASAGEMRAALDAGMAPARISFAGPGKRRSELRQAVAAGVRIHIESFREVGELAAIREETGWTPLLAVRVNPDFAVTGSGMRMGGGAKPFGVDAEQVPGLLAGIAGAGLACTGFHFFCGSQSLRPEAIAEGQRRSFDLALSLAGRLATPLTYLNLGGGFGIPYFPGDEALDLAPIAAGLARLAGEAQTALPHAELVLELGRYLVGEAGVYVCRVLDRKLSRGRTFLVTDGGLHHHLAASGNFGQVIRKNYPVVLGTCLDGPSAGPVSVTGPLCTPLDLLADGIGLPEAGPGDLVVVLQSGAYGASASPQAFLGHPPAVELLV